MQNNINNNANEKINTNKYTERPVKRYGMPASGRGKLLPGNTYVPPVKHSRKPAVDVKTNSAPVEMAEDLNSLNPVADVVDNKDVVAVENQDVMPVEKKEGFKVIKKVGKGFCSFGSRIVTTVTTVETPIARSVRSGEKSGKFPMSRIVLVGLLVVLLMFVVIDYVKIFENNQMIGELKSQLDSYSEEEKKLTSELAEQYDVVDIGEYAGKELGMVSGENQKKVYVDVSDDDTIEGYEVPTEDYGAIATIMNALGESARAWIEMFGEQ